MGARKIDAPVVGPNFLQRKLLGGALIERAPVQISAPRYRECHIRGLEDIASECAEKWEWIQKVAECVNWLAGHEGTALIIRNAIPIPIYVSKPERAAIRENPLNHSIRLKIEKRLKFLLSLSKLYALPEHFDKEEKYINHAIGPEHGVNNYDNARCKLPAVPSTLYPNRPFGRGLFGYEKGGEIDSICPDVLAYIFADKKDNIKYCGPIIYSVDEIKNELYNFAPATIDHLERNIYSINPDQGLTKSWDQDYGFGGVTKINILGMRKDIYPYMRFILNRTEHLNGVEFPIKNLSTALEKIALNYNKTGINIHRGDILLINNRRVAAQWNETAYFKKNPVLNEYEIRPLSHDDRTIFRMIFHLSEPICDE